jgi:hypothetical protein
MLKSATYCVKTHLPNESALKKDGAKVYYSYFAVEAIQPRAAARARVVRRLYFNE